MPDLLNYIYTTKFVGVLSPWHDVDKIIIESITGAIVMGKNARMYRDSSNEMCFKCGLDLCRGISF